MVMGAHWDAYVYTSSLCFYSNLLSTKVDIFTAEDTENTGNFKKRERKEGKKVSSHFFISFSLRALGVLCGEVFTLLVLTA
jgi:hypothetical protein